MKTGNVVSRRRAAQGAEHSPMPADTPVLNAIQGEYHFEYVTILFFWSIPLFFMGENKWGYVIDQLSVVISLLPTRFILLCRFIGPFP